WSVRSAHPWADSPSAGHPWPAPATPRTHAATAYQSGGGARFVRLYAQAQAECREDSLDRVEARLGARREGLVEAFTTKPGFTGEAGHSLGLGGGAEGPKQRRTSNMAVRRPCGVLPEWAMDGPRPVSRAMDGAIEPAGKHPTRATLLPEPTNLPSRCNKAGVVAGLAGVRPLGPACAW